jgi:hypothetical protein
MDIRLNQKRAFVTGARVAVNHVTRPEAAQSLVHRIKDQRGEMVPLKSGVVLNITSVHEQMAWSGYSAYTASKAAVNMLPRPWPKKLRPTACAFRRLGRGNQNVNQPIRLERPQKPARLAGENSTETDLRA